MNICSGILYKKDTGKKPGFFSAADFDFLKAMPGSWRELNEPAITFGIYNTANTASPCSYYKDPDAGLVFIGDIRLYNKDELAGLLGISPAGDDICLVAHAYKKWGAGCLKFLNGDFSFAAWNAEKRSLFCARDPLGQRPLYYYDSDECFFFSGKLQLLSAFAFAETLDDDWIIAFLQDYNTHKNKTVFKNIKALPAAHFIEVDSNGARLVRYWTLHGSSSPGVTSLEEAVEGTKAHLQKAVAARLSGYAGAGIELSGGLDSSLIAAVAANSSGPAAKELIAFSNSLPIGITGYEHFDESQKALQVVSHLGIKKHFDIRQSVHDPVTGINTVLDHVGQPTSDAVSLSQLSIFEKAATEGVQVLLSGLGGDHVVSTYARSAYMYSLAKAGKLGQLSRFIREQQESRAWLSVISVLMTLLRGGSKASRNMLNKNWGMLPLKDHWLRKENKRLYMQRPHLSPYISLKEKTQAEIERPGLTQRIETGNLITEHYGMRYAYPLLDIPLIEFCYGVEDKWRAAHKQGRTLARLAVQHQLPENITMQRKEGATVPYFAIEKEQRYQVLRDLCLGLDPKHRLYDYIDRAKLERLAYHAGNHSSQAYFSLCAAAMLGMFMDQRKKMMFHHV